MGSRVGTRRRFPQASPATHDRIPFLSCPHIFTDTCSPPLPRCISPAGSTPGLQAVTRGMDFVPNRFLRRTRLSAITSQFSLTSPTAIQGYAVPVLGDGMMPFVARAF